MKRDEFGFVLPNLYYRFLSEWEEIDPYEIGDTGICLYAKEDLEERNETYLIGYQSIRMSWKTVMSTQLIQGINTSPTSLLWRAVD